MDHETTAELHALKRLRQRYGERYGITEDNALDVMFEHLAMVLCDKTDCAVRQRRGEHRGNEIHRIYWEGNEFIVSYDPEIRRIVTYLPPTALTRKIIKKAKR